MILPNKKILTTKKNMNKEQQEFQNDNKENLYNFNSF